MSNENTALAEIETRPYRGLAMAMAPAESARRLQELQGFIKTTMKKGEDYGRIPGTDKDTLFQPGAQKLAELYGLAHKFVTAEAIKDWEKGFFYFEFRCELTSRSDGSFVGEGMGSCNSRESKYAGRWVPATELPRSLDPSTLQCREGGRWVFKNEIPEGLTPLESRTRNSPKTGRDYQQFKIVDMTYLVPNPDPYSLVNTIMKMGAKRAYIHAVIAATRSSGIFMQDVEDLPPEVFGQVEGTRPWESGDEDEDDGKDDPGSEHARLLIERCDKARTSEEVAAVWKDLSTAHAKDPKYLAPTAFPGLYANVFKRRSEFVASMAELGLLMQEIGIAKLPEAQNVSLRKPCRVAKERIEAESKKAATPPPAGAAAEPPKDPPPAADPKVERHPCSNCGAMTLKSDRECEHCGFAGPP